MSVGIVWGNRKQMIYPKKQLRNSFLRSVNIFFTYTQL